MSSPWVHRDRAKLLLGLTEDELSAAVQAGKVMIHGVPGTMWSDQGRQYSYWVTADTQREVKAWKEKRDGD